MQHHYQPVGRRSSSSNSLHVDGGAMKTSTKLYLTIVFSTLCILFYQYQLSKGLAGGDPSSNEVVSVERSRSVIELAALMRTGDEATAATAAAVGTPSRASARITAAVTTTTTTTVKPSSSTTTTTTTTTTTPSTTTSTARSKRNNTVTHDTITTLTTRPNATAPKRRHDRPDNDKPPPPPPLYIITPTYKRSEQVAEITRLGHTLKHVPNLFWLVIEDAAAPNALVTRQLQRIGVPFVHLVAPMPAKYQKQKTKPRGVSNRNRGLAWLRANATEGVFYFADDDNTYDLAIFEQMRYTRKVSMWPVGLVTKFGMSSPVVRDGKLAGFYDGWIGNRKYPVDMAGFAVAVQFFLNRPNALMPFKPGYEEDHFLKSLAPLEMAEIELLANNCTEILTWHTQTKKNSPATPLDNNKYGDTNLATLRQLIV